MEDRYYIVKKDLPWDDDYYILVDRKTGHHVNVGGYQKVYEMKLVREGYRER